MGAPAVAALSALDVALRIGEPEASAALGCASGFVYRAEYAAYGFDPPHPLRRERFRAALDLLEAAGLAPRPDESVVARAATRQELELIHRPEYISAVEALSNPGSDATESAQQWGLGAGDTPAFPGLHEAAAFVAGGTLEAVEGVLEGRWRHAFNPAGGLHHAFADHASGFCIYNDAAIAISAARRRHPSLRVLYLDFDAHHGDGVQAAFYADPAVVTLSFHEAGLHLFPGTGHVHELGDGNARGTSLNLPVEPDTEDRSWLECLGTLLPAVGAWAVPDLVVSQHGCDSHLFDPLSHLRLSTRALAAQATVAHGLAHRYADGRWVALGGGGYDWLRVVPRSWAFVWSEMSGRPLPSALPAGWLERWRTIAQAEGFWPLPAAFHDPPWPVHPRTFQIQRENRARAETLRQIAVPAIVRQAHGVHRQHPPKSSRERGIAALDGLRTLGTARGPLHLQLGCTLQDLDTLRPDPGLSIFTRAAHSEFLMLRELASEERAAVSVARTTDGQIVSFLVAAPPEGWWQGLPGVYELAFGTSRHWRRLGLARALLAANLAATWVEDAILVLTGLDWHRGRDDETRQVELSPLLRRLLAPYGFLAVRTNEPSITADPANVLLVRVGNRVPAYRRAGFDEALVIAPLWRS